VAEHEELLNNLAASPLFYLLYYCLGTVAAFIRGSVDAFAVLPGWNRMSVLIFTARKTESPKYPVFSNS
jgi:hypothetical protein